MGGCCRSCSGRINRQSGLRSSFFSFSGKVLSLFSFSYPVITALGEVGGLGITPETKERMMAAMNLPRDVFLGDILVSLIGRRTVLIENYRSILMYTDTTLKIQGKNCRLQICGKHLRIEYYTADEMKVNGVIESIELKS